MTDPSRREADPSRFVVDPSRWEVDPSRWEVDPSRREADQSRFMVDPSPRVADPSRFMADPSRREVDPSRFMADPSRREVDPSRFMADPSRREVDPSRFMADPSRREVDPVAVHGRPVASGGRALAVHGQRRRCLSAARHTAVCELRFAARGDVTAAPAARAPCSMQIIFGACQYICITRPRRGPSPHRFTAKRRNRTWHAARKDGRRPRSKGGVRPGVLSPSRRSSMKRVVAKHRGHGALRGRLQRPFPSPHGGIDQTSWRTKLESNSRRSTR